jgi:uncharacterized membrane protein
MLRFSQALAVSVLASTVLLGCGDKINPMHSNQTGGTTEVDGGGAGIDGGTPAAATYSATIKPLLDKYCNACHAPSPSLGIDPLLDTYSGAKANAVAANDAIQSGTMPPSGKAPTDAEAKAFQDWVNQGAPNN